MKQIFCEANGQLSLMRINSFLALIVAGCLSGYAFISHEQGQSFSIIMSWILGAFVPKALQKFAEK